MRSRSVGLAMLLTLSSAGGAGFAHYRAHQLKAEGQWLLERGSAQGEEYASTFDGKLADDEFNTLDQRRLVLDRAQLWQRSELLGILVAVAGAFLSYVLYLFRRLREQLVDANVQLDHGARV